MRASRVSLRVLNIGLMIAFLTFVTTGCAGASGDDDDDSAFSGDVSTGAGVSTQAASSGADTDAESSDEESTDAPAAGASEDDRSVQAQTDWNRLIIRTARLSLSVENVGQAVTWVRDIAMSKGGYVFSSNTYLQEDQQFGEITVQVPVETFDDTMNLLRDGELVAKVEREESTSQDVSSEFVDNESRVATLRETHSRFLELLSKATTVDEILKLEYELQAVREQIETIEGRQQYLEQATAFSTITVSLTPFGLVAPAVPEPVKEPGFSISGIFERAWSHSSGAIEDLLIASITIAIFSAVFLPIGLLAVVAFRLVRRRVRTIAASSPLADNA